MTGLQVFIAPIAIIMIFMRVLRFIRANGRDDEIENAKKYSNGILE